ncbi:MAG: malectin domain-containing carbohydrate-binding protein [Candidatus Acidiferrales bacterium]
MLNRKWMGATAFVALVLLCMSGAAWAQSVSVTVQQTNPGPTISPDFEGFSVEMLLAFPDSNGHYLFSGTNTALIGMFKSLGIKSMRMGGNSADNANDNGGQLPINSTCAAANSCPDADNLYAFAQAAGINVLWTLRLETYNTSAAATEAQYIMNKYASLTKCFQVGNEPNVYIGSYSTYDSDFQAYRSAVLAVAPNAKFCAPAVTNGGGQPWAVSFANEYKGDSTIELICGHYYPGARLGMGADDDITYLLAPTTISGGTNTYQDFYQGWVSTAIADNFTWRIEETNSLVSQGESGVSNVYAASLWGLDYAHYWEMQNAGGLNFHEGATSVYDAFLPTTLQTSYTAEPLAYGIKAFNLTNIGQPVLTQVSSNPSSVNMTAYSSLDPSTGNLYVTLINKDSTFSGAHNATVTLAPGAAYSGGKMWTMKQTSQDVTATTGITIGGATIGGDGTWNGTSTSITPNGNGSFTISLPYASAAMLELTGKTTSTPPNPPSNLAASAASSSQINLTWTASSTSGVAYSVFRSTTSGFTPSSSNEIAIGVSSTSYSDTGLSASTTYYYLVEATNDTGGVSTPTNQASATTPAAPPLTIQINAGGPAVSPFVADEDFSGGSTIDHANTINTSKVTNPAPAAVYQTARVNNFTYTIGGFNPGSSQLVRLHFCETFFTTTGSRVFNVSINGTQVLTNFDIIAASGGENIANIQQFTEPANSSGQYVISFTPTVNEALVSGIEILPAGSCSAPTAPSGLTATAASSSQINLSWTASSSSCAVTYNVFRSTTSGFTPSSSNEIASGVTTTTYSNTGLAASTAYYYLVEGTNSGGTSAASNQASATTSAGSCSAAPTAPSGLGATAASSSQINLTWTASTAGTGCSITYSVFRSTTSGFTASSSNQVAAGVTTTTYSDTGLAASTTYYYLVEGVDSAGSSAASNQASATTSASSGSCTSICIDSGSTTAVSPFVADEDFSGGGTINHANTINTSMVTNPAPAAVYQTARTGTFTYTIGGFTASSMHNVRLHFCETYFTASGKRTFNVSINGTQVLSAFDIFATAGGQNIANIQQFSEAANSSGQYVITFTTVVNSGLVSGIEID